MKKHLIMLGVCLAIVIGLNVNLQWKNVDQDRLGITMSNIEALANGENQEVSCTVPGSLDCPRSAIKVKYIL